MTRKENILVGVGPTAINSLKTECPAGHPYDAENTYVDKRGKRYCNECGRQRSKARSREKFGYTKPDFHLRTHCPKGHPYAGDNLYVHPTKKCRCCRTCRREQGATRYAANR